MAIDALVGVTAIETRVAAVTVSVADGLVTAPEVAVMLDVPGASELAKPEEVIVATAGVAEFQVAELVRF